MEHIATIISAICGVAVAIFMPFIASKIARKDKEFGFMIDKKFKEAETRDKENNIILSNIYSQIYGFLWQLLFEIEADRINIIQPHPEQDRQYISVSFEIVKPGLGIAPQKSNFQNKSMSTWAITIKKWIDTEYIIYQQRENIKDEKIYAEAYRRGTKSVVFYRLTNTSGYWVGTLCIDYMQKEFDIKNITHIKAQLKRAGVLIADLLPEYNPKQL